MNIPSLVQSYIPQDTYIALMGLFGVPGFFCMIALYISILRVHFAIKRDGKEPLGLGPIWLIELATAFMVTKSRYNRTIKHQAEHGVDLVPYALIEPYIRPSDRYIARIWALCGFLVCFLGFPYDWLYSNSI